MLGSVGRRCSYSVLTIADSEAASLGIATLVRAAEPVASRESSSMGSPIGVALVSKNVRVALDLKLAGVNGAAARVELAMAEIIDEVERRQLTWTYRPD